MKKSFLLLSVLFFAKIIIAQTLVASYPFNGNANDVVGSANGTVTGASLTTDRFGNTNSAYNFNGTSNYITGNASSFPVGDRTISLWFNADAGSIATIPAVFSYGGGSCGSSFLMLINNGGNGKYQTQGHCAANLNEYAYPSAPEANWYQWVVTISGSTIKMYINGVLVNTTSTYTNATFVAGRDFGIGALVNPNGVGVYNSPPALNYFKGKLDDVKIYTGTLTDAQIFDTYVNDIKKPGSGNTLSFNGTSQYIEVPDNPSFTFGTSFTASAWIKTTSIDADIFSNFETAFPFTGTLFGIGFGCIGNTSDPRAGRLGFYIGNNASNTSESYNDISGPRIDDNKWHNVAVSYNGSQVRFFVDGVATSIISASNNGIGNSSNVLRIGRDNNVAGVRYFNGSIDELQLWSTALPLNTIRDWMCKKLNSTHPAYTNLVSYFRFDEGSNTTTGGFAGNFGTLLNTPTWQTSGAALGDESTNTYGSTSASLGVANTGATINEFTGAPVGMQLYRVNESPNTTALPNGIQTFKSNNYYYGVFPIGGTSPTYRFAQRVVGLYTNTDYSLDSMTQVVSRPDNAGTWNYQTAKNNSTNDSIVVTGTSTEYAIANNKNNNRKPGSGNSLSFNGTTQSVIIPDNESWNFGAGDFAIEGWINPQNLSGFHTIITQSIPGAGTNQSSFYVGVNYNGTGSLDLYTTTGVGWTHGISTNTNVIQANKWQHFAITRQAGVAAIYVNGIVQAINQGPGSASIGIAPTIYNGTENITIGSQNTFAFYPGNIDEIRVFKGTGLTQTQVRDWMCKKINANHPAFTNLAGYFRFDEGTTNTTGGFAGNFGSLINSPAWQTSGAALGDASAHDYVNVTKTANISHATGENFAVTSTSGSPAGIQVYRVDEQPNTLTGAIGVGGNDKYFGVFQVGGTTPQYTAVYNYNGNPYVNAGNENGLRLFKRNDNAVSTWLSLAALPNEPSNTITITGESTEYILGTVGTPLPVTLLSFAGSKCNNAICLLWATENEESFSKFEVEKSSDGRSFSYMADITARNGAGTNSYNSKDYIPFAGDNFYRLKIINNDGSSKYSKIIKINLDKPQLISVQPNPASSVILINGIGNYNQLQVVDLSGKIAVQKDILKNLEEVNISQLRPGLYLIRLIKSNETISLKFIKQ